MIRSTRSFTQAVLFAALAAALSASTARAFTMEGEQAPGGSQYTMPKYDLEEQAKMFRNNGTDAPAASNKFSTPLGDGTLQFGVQQGPFTGFGPGFGVQTGPTQQDFNRLTAPPGVQHMYDSR